MVSLQQHKEFVMTYQEGNVETKRYSQLIILKFLLIIKHTNSSNLTTCFIPIITTWIILWKLVVTKKKEKPMVILALKVTI